MQVHGEGGVEGEVLGVGEGGSPTSSPGHYNSQAGAEHGRVGLHWVLDLSLWWGLDVGLRGEHGVRIGLGLGLGGSGAGLGLAERLSDLHVELHEAAAGLGQVPTGAHHRQAARLAQRLVPEVDVQERLDRVVLLAAEDVVGPESPEDRKGERKREREGERERKGEREGEREREREREKHNDSSDLTAMINSKSTFIPRPSDTDQTLFGSLLQSSRHTTVKAFTFNKSTEQKP